VARVDAERCRGCRACVTRCPFHAVSVDTATGLARVDAGACYGCGVCRHACDTAAIVLDPRKAA